MTAAVTQAARLGVETVVCASTGNTSASLAAYAARADLKCAILVPHGQISHAKLAQSLDYGAAVLELEGNFDDCMRISQLPKKIVLLVNSINRFVSRDRKPWPPRCSSNSRGVPDHVVVPGVISQQLRFGKGLVELYERGVIDRLPN